MRTVVIGDIHGCLDELDELLRLVDHQAANTRLISVGDLLDRGPDSVGVVRRCQEVKIETVMGNHEAKFLKWYRNSKFVERKDYYTAFNQQDISYIFKMPLYIQLQNTVVIHAGLKPGIAISAQSRDDLLYLRYTDSDKNFISIKKVLKMGKEAAKAHFWTEFGPFGSNNIICGHCVHSLTDIRVDKYFNNTACYSIDTGCCFGGRLTAFILETKEIIQVQAKQPYYNKFNL